MGEVRELKKRWGIWSILDGYRTLYPDRAVIEQGLQVHLKIVTPVVCRARDYIDIPWLRVPEGVTVLVCILPPPAESTLEALDVVLVLTTNLEGVRIVVVGVGVVVFLDFTLNLVCDISDHLDIVLSLGRIPGDLGCPRATTAGDWINENILVVNPLAVVIEPRQKNLLESPSHLHCG